MGVSMVAEYEQAITGDCRELQDALIGTESVEEFLHEMAVLAARLGAAGPMGTARAARAACCRAG